MELGTRGWMSARIGRWSANWKSCTTCDAIHGSPFLFGLRFHRKGRFPLLRGLFRCLSSAYIPSIGRSMIELGVCRMDNSAMDPSISPFILPSLSSPSLWSLSTAFDSRLVASALLHFPQNSLPNMYMVYIVHIGLEQEWSLYTLTHIIFDVVIVPKRILFFIPEMCAAPLQTSTKRLRLEWGPMLWHGTSPSQSVCNRIWRGEFFPHHFTARLKRFKIIRYTSIPHWLVIRTFKIVLCYGGDKIHFNPSGKKYV